MVPAVALKEPPRKEEEASPRKVTTFVAIGFDPTRTTALRNAFVSDMRKRFRELRGVMRRAIIDEDVFGLMPPSSGDAVVTILQRMRTPGRRAFAFPRSGEKVDGFMRWLRRQQEIGILEMPQVGVGVEAAWTNKYIQSGYQRGIMRARGELKNAGFDVPSIAESGGIAAAFNQPFHLDRVGLLYTRTFNDLQGITNAMDGQISRVLAQGMADGRNPRELARLLTKTVKGPVGGLGITDTLGRFIPAERRAEILARTEIIRAHHVATIQEYENWGAVGVKVKAEWATAGDERVCPDCAALEGHIFTLEEIRGMIPLHALCRCIAIPVPATIEQQTLDRELGTGRLPLEKFNSRGFLEKQVVYKELSEAFDVLIDGTIHPMAGKVREHIFRSWQGLSVNSESAMVRQYMEKKHGAKTLFHKKFIDHDPKLEAAFAKEARRGFRATKAMMKDIGLVGEPIALEVVEQVMDAQYEFTQYILRRQRRKSIKLFRGTGAGVGDPGTKGKMAFNSLSSWSTSRRVGEIFASTSPMEAEVAITRRLVEARIPARQVFFLPESSRVAGFDVFAEAEVGVIGSEPISYKVLHPRRLR